MSHPLVVRMHSDRAAERRDACRDVVDDPSAVLLVDALVETLGDPEPTVVRAAAGALQQLARDCDAVRTALQAALRGDDPRRRFEVAWTWAQLEPPPVKILPILVATLESAEGDTRWRATRLLVELARLHAEVLPVVQGLAERDDRPRLRRMALVALRELAPHEPRTGRALLAASRDSDLGLARRALTELAGLEAPGPGVWERLAEVLASHPDAACRRVAAMAAGALGVRSAPPDGFEAKLRRATDDADPSVREASKRALGRFDSLEQQRVE